MKLEDAGSSRLGTGCASCWPPIVLLRPSRWLLWEALTRLGWFCLRILIFADPTTIMGPILDMVAVLLDVEAVLYEESDDA
jgi:hypothetical protein